MNNELVEIIKQDCSEAARWSLQLLEDIRNQKILITGGTGFVGTWISEYISFLNDNFNFNVNIILISRDIDAFKVKCPQLCTRKDIKLISKDVRNIDELPIDVNYVIHSAASPDNRHHVSDPIETISVITKGTQNIIDNAFKLPNLKKILYLSSGQIYGKVTNDNNSISEHDFGPLDCNSITSIYPESKRLAESICCAFWSLYKLPITIARPFSFIGPYQLLNKPWAVNSFINDALFSKTVRIIGNGEPIRSYMYPSDMTVWILKILLDGIPGKAYNVGSPYGICLKELAKKIVHYSKSDAHIEIKNYNQDKSKYIPNISISQNELGLKINYDADKTIEKAVIWFKELIDKQSNK